MRKILIPTVLTAAAGIIAIGYAFAQQAAPAAPQTPSGTAQPSAPKSTPKTAGTKSGTSTTAAKKPSPAPPALKTNKDKASYAIGLNMGKGMRREEVDIDPALLYRGLKDGLGGDKALLSDEEARAAVLALQTEVRKKQQEKQLALAESNKKTGDAFLAENKTKEGVVTLPSGLQYKVLQEGTGAKPQASDTVECKYRGTLIDNTEFDNSAKRPGPAIFPVTGVIKGWTEALELMPVGSKWQLFVPPELAYGPSGRPGIGPNATLVFEIELVSIQPKAQPAAQPAPSPGANPAPNTTPNPGATPNPGGNANPSPTPNPTPKPNPTPAPNPTPTPTH